MRLELILPRLEPTNIFPPVICPYESCEGRGFRFLEKVGKALRDTVYRDVTATVTSACVVTGLPPVSPRGEPGADIRSGVWIGGDKDNRPKHPHDEVLERLEGTPLVHRTDENGTVTITSDGHGLWIETER